LNRGEGTSWIGYTVLEILKKESKKWRKSGLENRLR